MIFSKSKILQPIIRWRLFGSHLFAGAIIGLAFLYLSSFPATAQTFTNPSTSETFLEAIQNLSVLQNYEFGTNSDRNVKTISQLSTIFSPYGIAGHNVINEEWERYQAFNTTNFAFTATSLNLTATIPSGGGLFPGGIDSGQIWTNATY